MDDVLRWLTKWSASGVDLSLHLYLYQKSYTYLKTSAEAWLSINVPKRFTWEPSTHNVILFSSHLVCCLPLNKANRDWHINIYIIKLNEDKILWPVHRRSLVEEIYKCPKVRPIHIQWRARGIALVHKTSHTGYKLITTKTPDKLPL